MSCLLKIFLGLTEDFVEDRMSLAEALQCLRLVLDQLADDGISSMLPESDRSGDAELAQGGGGETIVSPESEERCCVVCWHNPREVRSAPACGLFIGMRYLTYHNYGVRFASVAVTRRCVAAATMPCDRDRSNRSSAPTAEPQSERRFAFAFATTLLERQHP